MALTVFAKSSRRAQILQMLFHWCMASAALLTVPAAYLEDPTSVSNSDPKPTSVCMIYLTSVVYNCVLYFWDPIDMVRLRVHHIASILVGTVMILYRATEWSVVLLVLTLLLDTHTNPLGMRTESVTVRFLLRAQHMVTIALMAFSWSYGFVSHGIFLMFIHDLTDVPMFALRLYNEKYPSDRGIVNLFLSATVLSTWSYFRIWKTGAFLYEVSAQNGGIHSGAQAVCFFGVFVVLIFNCHWTGVVAKRVWQAVSAA